MVPGSIPRPRGIPSCCRRLLGSVDSAIQTTQSGASRSSEWFMHRSSATRNTLVNTEFEPRIGDAVATVIDLSVATTPRTIEPPYQRVAALGGLWGGGTELSSKAVATHPVARNLERVGTTRELGHARSI